VGFLGSVVAVVMGGVKTNKGLMYLAFLLCASSVVSASLASFVLGKHDRQCP
jgi:solute carrier family 41